MIAANRFDGSVPAFFRALAILRSNSSETKRRVSNNSASLLSKWKFTVPAVSPAIELIFANVTFDNPYSATAVIVASISNFRLS